MKKMIILEQYEFDFRNGNGELIVDNERIQVNLCPGTWKAGYIKAPKDDESWNHILFLFLGATISREDAQAIAAGSDGVGGIMDHKCKAYIGLEAHKVGIGLDIGDQVFVHAEPSMDDAVDMVGIIHTGPFNALLDFTLTRCGRTPMVGFTPVKM